MNHRDEARDFLSTRRARITPEFARYHADFVDETLRTASLSEHDRVVVQLIGYPRTLNALAAVNEGAPAA
jgi:hypothetical protein